MVALIFLANNYIQEMSNSKNIREWSQNVVYSCGLGVSCTSYLDVKCVENLSPTSPTMMTHCPRLWILRNLERCQGECGGISNSAIERSDVTNVTKWVLQLARM